MSGGIPAYENLISTGKFRAVAMSVFASGAIPPHEALEFVCKQPNVKSIVFGASNIRNIKQTKQLIDTFDQARDYYQSESKELRYAKN
jgi:aryl-alcohol dehydrogenase-like predicted oxidoreductase